MKLKTSFGLILLVVFAFIGCSSKGEKEENNMQVKNNQMMSTENIVEPTNEPNKKEDHSTFLELNWAQESKTIKPLNQITKIIVDIPGKEERIGRIIAVDITKNELYLNIQTSMIDQSSPTVRLTDEEVKQFIDIFREEKVQEWKRYYNAENDEYGMNSFCWIFTLVNEDGTLEEHSGVGQKREECTPENYDTVIEKIMKLKFITDNLKE